MKISPVYYWKKLLKEQNYRFSLAIGIALWAVGYFFYGFVIGYVDNLQKVVAVPDLFLDALPVVDLRYLYFFGMMTIIGLLFFYLVLWRPDLLPFGLKVFALVFMVRTVFIALTHLGPPEGFLIPRLSDDYNFWPFQQMLHFNDLFFSGHVAYAFMAALLVRHHKGLFYFFLISSVVMLFTVLLMRIHYSIDVFAAYFIAYGVYAAAFRFFGKKDLVFEKIIF